MFSATVKIGYQRQFLEDCNDAGAHGVGGAGETDRPALERHGPGIGLDHAAHDLDEGRLASAILAEHRMNAAALDRQSDVVERANSAVVLADAVHSPERHKGPPASSDDLIRSPYGGHRLNCRGRPERPRPPIGWPSSAP